MATRRRLANASPKPSGARFGRRFMARFAIVSGVTALLLLLSIVLTAGPLPSWTSVVAAIGGISLLVGILAGLFGEHFVDCWLKSVNTFLGP